MVHERFTGDELRRYRAETPGVQIIAHPECPPDVLAEADYVGSTAGMIDFVASARPERVVMVTECSMADNVALESPGAEFVRPCNLCPHMKRITLAKIRHSLRDDDHRGRRRPRRRRAGPPLRRPDAGHHGGGATSAGATR